MKLIADRALILRTLRFGERDLILSLLTENHGKMSAIAKGGVHSRRFGGALQTFSSIKVNIVQKETADMVRIDQAIVDREFMNLPKDLGCLSVASFASEVLERLLEPFAPSREHFVLLANTLYYLDSGASAEMVVLVFLTKLLDLFGVAPQWSVWRSDQNVCVSLSRFSEYNFKELFSNDRSLVYPEESLELNKELFGYLWTYSLEHLPGLTRNGEHSRELNSRRILREITFL